MYLGKTVLFIVAAVLCSRSYGISGDCWDYYICKVCSKCCNNPDKCNWNSKYFCKIVNNRKLTKSSCSKAEISELYWDRYNKNYYISDGCEKNMKCARKQMKQMWPRIFDELFPSTEKATTLTSLNYVKTEMKTTATTMQTSQIESVTSKAAEKVTALKTELFPSTEKATTQTSLKYVKTEMKTTASTMKNSQNESNTSKAADQETPLNTELFPSTEKATTLTSLKYVKTEMKTTTSTMQTSQIESVTSKAADQETALITIQPSPAEEITKKIKNISDVQEGFDLMNNKSQEVSEPRERARVMTAFLDRVEDVISEKSTKELQNSNQTFFNQTTSIFQFVAKKIKTTATIKLDNGTSVTIDMGNKSETTIVTTLLYLKDVGNEMESSKHDIHNLKSELVIPHKTGLRRISKIMSASIHKNNTDVNVTFKLEFLEYQSQNWLTKLVLKCGFFNTTSNKWSTQGCHIIKKKPPYCKCQHMTNFAYLVHIQAINQGHKKALMVLSIIGGTLNCLALLLFMIFALFINPLEKLQLDLFNVALCLFLGVLVYLFSGLFIELSIMCKLVAMLAEFLLLSAFFWKLVIGISVVRKISTMQFQEDYVKKYPYIFGCVCYGVSLLAVALSGLIGQKYYGPIGKQVCWVQASSPPYIAFVVLLGSVVAINLMCAVIIGKVLMLFVTMGCTWTPLYLATNYLAAAYIMVIFMPLQGVLMFLLVVVIDQVNRDKVSSFLVSLTSRTNNSDDLNLSRSRFTRHRSRKCRKSGLRHLVCRQGYV